MKKIHSEIALSDGVQNLKKHGGKSACYAGGMAGEGGKERPAKGERKLGELALIEAIERRAAEFRARRSKPARRGGSAPIPDYVSTLVRGIGDDCAVLRPRPGEDLVVTTDLSLERIHFRRDLHPPESVGHRCLARGLSDLAAMGAHPEAAFLSLALPRALTGRWMERFLDGLFSLAARYGVPLAGGDTAESSALVSADIVLLGSVPAGRSLLRSTARAGDTLYVTGALGGAAAELRALKRNPAAFRKRDRQAHPHLYPEPRVEAGRKLLECGLATAAIDLSDGLSTDLSHICERSGLNAVIDAQEIPVAAGATLEDALHGGEDYELLFTARPRTAIPAVIPAAIPENAGDVRVHAIGKMTKRAPGVGSRVEIRARDGERMALRPKGWEHFVSRR